MNWKLSFILKYLHVLAWPQNHTWAWNFFTGLLLPGLSSASLPTVFWERIVAHSFKCSCARPTSSGTFLSYLELGPVSIDWNTLVKTCAIFVGLSLTWTLLDNAFLDGNFLPYTVWPTGGRRRVVAVPPHRLSSLATSGWAWSINLVFWPPAIF